MHDPYKKTVISNFDSNGTIEKYLLIRQLGFIDYEAVWSAMQQFTDQRDSNTLDEIWWVQHSPVFTQGQAGKAEHLLATGDIRVVNVDRGGQVTYHGPGQLIGYLMINLKRKNLGVRALVAVVEQMLIKVLALYNVPATTHKGAPGVYVAGGAKIAQLGFRIRKGCSFHGLSLNVDMDLEPFSRINPCGYKGLEVTSLEKESRITYNMDELVCQLSEQLCSDLGYTEYHYITDGVLPQ